MFLDVVEILVVLLNSSCDSYHSTEAEILLEKWWVGLGAGYS